MSAMQTDDPSLDDFPALSRNGWRVFTDTVMGGVSSGELIVTVGRE
jgi:hypothetical protein